MKIIKCFITTLWALCSICISAQTSDWLWAISAGGTDYDYANAITTDTEGNIYVTGGFSSSEIVFGNITLTNANAGTYDLFIVKYDPAGDPLWASSFGGDGEEYGMSVETDLNNNVFLAGYFNSTEIIAGTDTLTTNGSYDPFIIKFDPSGNVIWTTSVGGNDYDFFNEIAFHQSGHLYVTGTFKSPTLIFGSDTLINSGGYDFFVAKYDTLGNVIWARSSGDIDNDQTYTVSCDAQGNVFVGGRFNSPSLAIGSSVLTNQGANDLFLVKYSPDGNVLWAQSAGNSSSDGIERIFADPAGNVYATGPFYSSSIDIGAYTLTNHSTSSDYFIFKTDPDGNVLWARSEGGDDYDAGCSIASNTGGKIFVTGNFLSLQLILGTDTLSSNGSHDSFVLQYDTSGNLEWVRSFGSISWDNAYDIATDPDGNIFITGWFNSPTLTFGSTVLTSNGNDDIFIAKLSNTTGIEDTFFSNDNIINIFPNPFSRSATIQANTLLNNATLFFYNVQGQIVKQINNMSGQSITIHRDQLPAGVYFVRIIDDNNFFASGSFVID